MSEFKYKIGDRVRIKSLDWYHHNKDGFGSVCVGDKKPKFTYAMSKYCGQVLTVDDHSEYESEYYMIEDVGAFTWTDEMIEGLVEEETTINKWTGLKVELELSKSVIGVSNVESLHGERFMSGFVKAIIPPEGYICKDENGNIINAQKIVLEKKKKEYPKTYMECCEILFNDISYAEFTFVPAKISSVNLSYAKGDFVTDLPSKVIPYKEKLNALYKLLICRDAYWKIAGEEMGLGKPWEPDWKDDEQFKYIIICRRGCIIKDTYTAKDVILAFPTEEMRDAFKENFDPDIEICKELL